MGRPSKWAKHRNEMIRLYVEEEWSRGQIARHLGTSAVTVTRQLSAAGVQFESRAGDNPNASRSAERKAEIAAKISASRKGKGTGPRVKRETRSCEKCGAEYTYIPGRTGEKYCSRPCSVAASVEDRTSEVRSAYAADPKRCPCGQPVSYEYRNTRQYCSVECRRTFGAKRAENPDNWVTFECQTCGKEVRRRRSAGGARKFCSNECAAKHTKTVRHYMARDSDVVLDSTWEMLVYGIFAFHKIDIERFDRAEVVEWEPGHWYGPDFILPRIGVAIEVKGVEDPDDRRKWEAFTERTRIPVVAIGRAEIEATVGTRESLLSLVGS